MTIGFETFQHLSLHPQVFEESPNELPNRDSQSLIQTIKGQNCSEVLRNSKEICRNIWYQPKITLYRKKIKIKIYYIVACKKVPTFVLFFSPA